MGEHKVEMKLTCKNCEESANQFKWFARDLLIPMLFLLIKIMNIFSQNTGFVQY